MSKESISIRFKLAHVLIAKKGYTFKEAVADATAILEKDKSRGLKMIAEDKARKEEEKRKVKARKKEAGKIPKPISKKNTLFQFTSGRSKGVKSSWALPAKYISSKAGNVVNISINQVNTDPGRFQNRKTAYSKASAMEVAKNFNPNLFDPIVVWRDPRNKKTYVLSGHSRLEGMKMRGVNAIPARYFKGSEAEAITFSKVDANRAATKETLIEDITAFRLMRDGEDMAGIKPATKAALKRKWGTKYNKLEAYSHLNENGKWIFVLSQDNKSNYPYVETRALWTADLKQELNLSNNQERDMFLFLYSGTGKNLKLDKDEFFRIVRQRALKFQGTDRLFPECSDNGECGKFMDYEEKGPEAATYKAIRDKEKEIEDIRKRIKTRGAGGIVTVEEKKIAIQYANQLEDEIKSLKNALERKKRTEKSLFSF